jgi:hypothetical protein
VTARCFAAVGLLVLGCSTRILQTAEEPPAEDATAPQADGPAGSQDAHASCGATLAERLTVTHIPVGADIRYKAPGYDSFPEDARIALAVDDRGAPRVAWLDDALSGVHVTPLTPELGRAGPDVDVPGIDIGGLVARTDGFALLTRRDDPGTPLEDPANGGIGKAAFLVRVRGATESWAAPLTGTASVTSRVTGPARDCATALNGRLAWNGGKYGAYFTVHGCEGDAHASYYGDKLAYLDDSGAALPGGWAWNCSINQGIRLLPEPGVFTSLCISDGAPFPGLDLVVEDVPPRQLAPEASGIGYSAGRFGSVVKMGDGSYVVGWLSRGTVSSGGSTEAARRAQDIALLRLGPDYSSLAPLTWLTETPDVAETNLHLARYGTDRIAIVWDAIEDLDCSPLTCFGTYTGTHARLLDATGRFLTPDETIPAPPNSAEDLVVLPDGDLAWAFVEEDARSYASPLTVNGGGAPEVPPAQTLAVARLAYCP